eukprot:PRCOL_00004765-RA
MVPARSDDAGGAGGAGGASGRAEDMPGNGSGGTAATPCWLWLRSGACAYGDACRYAHPADLAGSQRPPTRRKRSEGAAEGGEGGKRSRPANRGKAGVFRRWLLDAAAQAEATRAQAAATPGSPSSEAALAAAADSPPLTPLNTRLPPALCGTVLDVAGGRGELSFELLNLNGVDAVVIDPRPGNVAPLHKKFHNGWYHRNKARAPYNTIPRAERSSSPRRVRAFFAPELWKTEAGQAGAEREPRTNEGRRAMLRNEATDWVLDYALEHDLPFAVVPCCVHWKAFPSRQVDGKPVRTIDDLIEYLKRRGGPGTLTAELDFEGQSTVVYKL